MSEVFVTDMARGALGLRLFFFVFISIALLAAQWAIRQELRDFRAALKKGLDIGSKILFGVKVAMAVVMLVLIVGSYFMWIHTVSSEGKWTKVVTTIESKEPLSYDELTIKARDSLAEVEDQIEGEFLRWEIRAVVKEESNDSRNP